MKVVDLFCGCGGMGLGFQQAGFEIVYALDFDKYAVQSYRKNVGSHAIQGDIKEVKGKDIPAADVWTFGFPCQDVSVAGKQAGMEVGTRSGLFYEVMRLLDEREDKPEFIMAENVKGLRPYLAVVEEEFAKRGYKVKLELYNSKYWGVPQSRERYYIIGYRNTSVVMPVQSDTYDLRLSDVLESGVSDKYYIDDTKAKSVIEQAARKVDLVGTHATITPDRVDKRQNGRRSKPNEEEMFTLTAQDIHGIIMIGRLNMSGKDQIRRVHDPEGISPTITAVQGGHHHVKIVSYDRKDGIGKELDVAYTLNASDWRGLNRNQCQNAIVDNLRVRRLTPREYARLQGFPESYDIVVSDTQAYKQFGNSVTVPLVKAIAEAIKAALW